MIEGIRAISHGLRTRLFAAALLLPLMAVVTATSGVGLRCRITGEVSNACCCDDATAQAATVATVTEAECCDRLVRDVTTAPAELSATQNHTTPVVHVAFQVQIDAPSPSAFLSRSEARTSIGPPTVRLRLVSKSSFLI
jgi:hypothetical protein